MRKVNSGLFITLDGVTESPDQWQFDSFDDDMMATMTAHIAAEDTLLLGRVTYQDWTHYWPMAQTFMRLGLIDEYRINVNPVVLGRGVPLFAGLQDTIKLRLVHARTYASGVVGLHYQKG